MTYEWVSPSATAVTAGLGLFFTWLTSKQGREHAENVARQACAAARQLAHDARKGDAYVDLLAFVTQAGYTLAALNPVVKLVDDPEPPALPGPDAQALYNAKVHAHGTTEVIKLYEEWYDHARNMIANTRRLKLAEGLQSGGLNAGIDVAAIYLRQADELKALTEAADSLRRQINQELCGD
jgi:hypothetical protein